MMHKAKSLFILFSLALAANACGGKADPSETAATTPVADQEPTSVTSEPVAEDRVLTREDVGEEMLLMLTELVELSKTHQGDCEATAASFREAFALHRDALDAGKKMEEVPEDQQWFEENYSYKFNNQAMLMREHLGDCMADPDFQNVMGEMN